MVVPPVQAPPCCTKCNNTSNGTVTLALDARADTFGTVRVCHPSMPFPAVPNVTTHQTALVHWPLMCGLPRLVQWGCHPSRPLPAVPNVTVHQTALVHWPLMSGLPRLVQWGCHLPTPLPVVPNVTVHQSMASVPTVILPDMTLQPHDVIQSRCHRGALIHARQSHDGRTHAVDKKLSHQVCVCSVLATTSALDLRKDQLRVVISQVLYAVRVVCNASTHRWDAMIAVSDTAMSCCELVHGQVTIIFVVSVCLFVQSFSEPSSNRFGSN